MKKKVFHVLLALTVSCVAASGFAACGGSNPPSGNNSSNSDNNNQGGEAVTHVHTYSEEWSSDATYHWHAATCEHTGEVSDKDKHDFEGGECTVCHRAESTFGLEYELSADETYYSVTGIGSATDSEIVIPSVHLGLPVKSIAEYAFSECSFLTSITIPDGVTSIEDYAFNSCGALTKVSIPDSVTSIGASAFRNCTSLVYNQFDHAYYLGNEKNPYLVLVEAEENAESCTIHENAKFIFSAFILCRQLESITIPDGILSIDSSAFNYCTSLTSITVDENNTAYCDVDGVLFNRDKTMLIRYPAGKTETEYAVPDSVTSLANTAFWNCSSLTGIKLPDGITSIGSAFAGCKSLTSMTLPDGVEHIEKLTFSLCRSLTSITIPKSVVHIGYQVFNNCTSLTDIFYEGEKAEWDKMFRFDSWDTNSGDYTVHCTDVSFAKES